MHGDIFANGCIRPLIFNQYADARAMQIAGQAMRGLNPLKAANSQVFADFSDEMGAHLIHRSAGWSAFKGSCNSSATLAGACFTTHSATLFAKSIKSAFLATKSVSQFSSTSAPALPSICAAMTPSAVMRAADLPALWPSLT